MRTRFVWPLPAIVGLALWALPALGQERMLTLEGALDLARERGAGVALAQGRVEEARARQGQAARRFQENPALEVNGGYRRAEEDHLDFEAALSQDLYTGRTREARLAGTRAAFERAEAELEDARRLLLREVWTTFARAAVAGDRVTLVARSRQAADELLAASERRYEAGEATALELNRARTAAATARAEQSGAEAERDAALAELKALLGLAAGEAVTVRKMELRPPLELDVLLAGLDRRPDLRALAAELREAEAEVLLGRSLARPGLGVRGGLAREEGAEIITAGVVVTLPVHNRGQETVAVGEARAAALRQALETARAAAAAEVRGQHSALSRRLAAVRELEQTALPALDDNESLALKSFDAGEIDLGELLLIRREILETRLAHLERLLEAALTRFELEAAAGALP
ncbi:MAG TPA: TolC family protein [Thermoanaerobaculia bacterium]|nr:TolC family protein [Thermoanaerobaculia bacterium]